MTIQIEKLKAIFPQIVEIENAYALETVSDFGPPQGGKRCKGMVSGGMAVYGTEKRIDEIGKLKNTMQKDEIKEIHLCSNFDRFAMRLYGKARTWGLDHHESMLVVYLYDDWRKEDPPLLYITYVCERCSLEWNQTHDCECNDRCPNCNQETEPIDAYELTESGGN